jgi:hypothetical protein
MDGTKTVLRHLRTFGRIRGFECEIEAELFFHIDMRTQDHIEAGMPPENARQKALEQFGDFEEVKQRCSVTRQASLEARVTRAIKLLSWILALSGLSIILTGTVEVIRHSGHVLIAIAILLRLFFYVRNLRPANQHKSAAQQEKILFDR